MPRRNNSLGSIVFTDNLLFEKSLTTIEKLILAAGTTGTSRDDSINQLANLLPVNRNTVSRNLISLADKGIIKRVATPAPWAHAKRLELLRDEFDAKKQQHYVNLPADLVLTAIGDDARGGSLRLVLLGLCGRLQIKCGAVLAFDKAAAHDLGTSDNAITKARLRLEANGAIVRVGSVRRTPILIIPGMTPAPDPERLISEAIRSDTTRWSLHEKLPQELQAAKDKALATILAPF